MSNPISFDGEKLSIDKNGGASGLELVQLKTGKGDNLWNYPGVLEAKSVRGYLTGKEVDDLLVDSFNRELQVYWRQSKGVVGSFKELLKNRLVDQRGKVGTGSSYWSKKIAELMKIMKEDKTAMTKENKTLLLTMKQNYKAADEAEKAEQAKADLELEEFLKS